MTANKQPFEIVCVFILIRIIFKKFAAFYFCDEMKFAAVIILFIAVVSATFSKNLMLLCFQVNQNYIAKEICVNRNKPMMHCDGKCFLNKQMTNEEKPSSPFNSNTPKTEVQLFCNELPAINFSREIISDKNFQSPHFFIFSKRSKDILHPPQLV